ncbi:PEP-CTERM sorting domain-containing protein [Thermopirellula anaerolimosa]
MRKIALWLAVLAFTVAIGGSAYAGVISAMSSQNLTDDIIQDDSHGFLVDVNNNGIVDVGDVGFGIAQVAFVNTTATLNTAYVVYSAEISSISNGVVYHNAVTSGTYTLENLLGVASGTFNKSIAVVLEWSGAGNNPFAVPANSATYPFDGLTGSFSIATSGQMQSDILALASNSTVLFGVGRSSQSDIFAIQLDTNPLGGYKHSVTGELSIMYTAAGLNIADFKPLLSNNAIFAASDVQIMLDKAPDLDNNGNFFGYSYASQGGTIATKDDGNYSVNYVPEPASMIGLASLALAGAGLGFVRRRKA